jgi:hypothetical protein
MLLVKARIESKAQIGDIMNEIFFVVDEELEGGYSAKALGSSIFTQAETIEELHQQVLDAVQCHFDPADMPKAIRLHYVREELIAV